MTMRKHHKRRKRRRAKMLAKHGPGSVRPHKRKTGRTGSIRSKQTPSSQPIDLAAPQETPKP